MKRFLLIKSNSDELLCLRHSLTPCTPSYPPPVHLLAPYPPTDSHALTHPSTHPMHTHSLAHSPTPCTPAHPLTHSSTHPLTLQVLNAINAMVDLNPVSGGAVRAGGGCGRARSPLRSHAQSLPSRPGKCPNTPLSNPNPDPNPNHSTLVQVRLNITRLSQRRLCIFAVSTQTNRCISPLSKS